MSEHNGANYDALSDARMRTEAQEVELPGFGDGKPWKPKLKRLSLLGLARSGKIPNELLSAVTELYQYGTVKTPDLKLAAETMYLIAGEALAEPTLTQLEEAGVPLTDSWRPFICMPGAAWRPCGPFVKSPQFLVTARMARLYRQRPSALLGIPDPYVAYCVDEAAAWLLSQKEEPTYGDAPGKGRASKAVFNTAHHLQIVEKHGGAKVKRKEAAGHA